MIREELERAAGRRPARGARQARASFTSPGGYILGEESALIECMEGHRGEPRNKPPFPAVDGLHGKPTLMNSVETFADVPVIVERGAEWWQAQGVNGGSGLKFFAVSGPRRAPGVYCVPMGTTARELIEQAGGMAGGAELRAFQPGGASSNFLGPEALDVPLDFDPLAEAGSMLGSGALVVVAEGTDLLAAGDQRAALLPQRVVRQVRAVPGRLAQGARHARGDDRAGRSGSTRCASSSSGLEETLRLTSICGLGQVALGPVLSVSRLRAARPGPRGDAR